MTCYEFYLIIISAVDSLATVAAVIVALYLANNSNKVKVTARVSKYIQIGGNQSFLNLNIRNKSIHKIRVTSIDFAIGKRKKTHFITKVFISNFVNKIYIEPKDSVDILGEWDVFEQVYINLKKNKFPELLKKGLKKNMLFIVVHSSSFNKPLLVPFKDNLIESINKITIED